MPEYIRQGKTKRQSTRTVEIQMQVQMCREAHEALPYKMHGVQARIEPSRHPYIVQCTVPLVQVATL